MILNDWRKRLLRWLKRFLPGRERQPLVKVVKSWQTNFGTLHRIDRGIAGAVATYRFLPNYRKGYDLLITTDQIRWSSHNRSGKRTSSGEGSATPSWAIALSAPSHPTPSHILALIEISRYPDPSTKSIRVKVRWAYFVDFIGVRVYSHPDYWARIITAEIAQQLLLISEDEIDWEVSIHENADKYVQSNHEALIRKKS